MKDTRTTSITTKTLCENEENQVVKTLTQTRRKDGTNMKNTRITTIIPKTLCGAETNQELNNLRQMLEGGDALGVAEDGSLIVNEKEDSRNNKKKLGKVPAGVLGTELREEDGPNEHDPLERKIPDDLINEFRECDICLNESNPSDSTLSPKPGKSIGKVPKGILGIQEVNDLRQMLEGGDPLEATDDGSIVREREGDKGDKKKMGKVPGGILGRALRGGTRVTCWCCHNEVTIPDSGVCPICGAVN